MPRIIRRYISPLYACLLAALLPLAAAAQTATQTATLTPKEQFGFNIGDDYQLANFTQLTDYWRKLDAQSDRMSLVEIGKTAEGRTMLMAIITSPENHKNLERYKQISARLARAEGLTDDEARKLAAEGRAVVWLDGGLHATEVLGPAQLLETVYQLVSRTDPETMRFLNDDIILCTLVNPDGMELVSNWYMRNNEPTARSTAALPRLYQKYIGHDNNRDFYMSNQPESENINRIFYLEWFPQIVYNHHQTGPPGTVMFAPPFRDPFNFNFDPLVPLGVDLVGAAMHSRFAAEGKPGVTMRSGANYSTWWNGGLRTTVYFHNMIGLLTESIGNPTPIEIPFVPENQLPRADLPFPIAPQRWHFRQSIEYSVTANRAVLDIASRNREVFLFNSYRMGMNSIERGSRDSWTVAPKRIAAIQAAVRKEAGQSGGRPMASMRHWEMMRSPELRDPRGFVLPSDQPDFLTATKFINVLLKNGITVHRATASFTVAGKTYPAGSYVVKTAQAFRPHVMDMFEPQDHPDDIPYPGGPPRPPYDVTGYTLAMQMDVKFDRVLDAFDGPFEVVKGLIAPGSAQAAKMSAPGKVAGYILDHRVNDTIIAVNRLLAGNEDVYWMKGATTAGSKSYPPGAVFVTAKPTTLAVLQKTAADVGVAFDGVATKPSGDMMKLRPVRIGLADQYGGSITSGWIRWILEQYQFPKFEVVYPRMLDAGQLSARYDVLIFPDAAIPEREGVGYGGQPAREEDIPAEFRGWLGRVTISKTVPELKKFLEEGGTVLAIGGSASLGHHLGLPIANALVERSPSAGETPLPAEKFYVPGSILDAAVDNSSPLAYGLGDRVNVFYDHSPAFRLSPGAALKGVRPVAWFDSASPLRSGWAWGQVYLDGAVQAVDASVGRGRLFLFAPEITFRAQPHGTFKFLFNGIYYGPAVSQRAAPPAGITPAARGK